MTNNSRSRWVYTGLLAVFLVATAGQAQAQNAVISGRVISEFEEPLEAAQVFIQELNIITTTNATGNYTLTVPGERARGQAVQLRVRRIGFAPDARQVTLAAGPQTVNFMLRQDATRLTEVVVTGVTAGTEMRKLPFSVDRVAADEIPVPALNPLTQLQGKVPGATIVGTSGRPGVAPQVLLRGPMSLNATGRSQGPLYILDGVLITGGLPDINPSDIESVEVVKGAAASSLYGAQAGSGVIQITTKSARGAADGVRFTVRSEIGVGDIEGDFGIARNHALVMDETRTRFCVTAAAGTPYCARTIDWNQEIMRVNNMPEGTGTDATVVDAPAALVTSQYNAPIPGMPAPLRQRFQTETYPMRVFNAVETGVQNKPLIQNNIDMQGRFGQTSFFASVGHTTQEGAIRFIDGFNRTSARVNIDQQIGSSWSIAFRNMYSESENHGWWNDGGSGTSFFYLTRQPPPANMLQRDTLGRLLVRTDMRSIGGQNINPMHFNQFSNDPIHTRRYIGGGTLRYTPAPWLDLDAGVGYDYDNTTLRFFVDKGTRTGQAGAGAVFYGGGRIDNQLFNTRSFNGSVSATARRELLPDLQTRFTARTFFQRFDQDFDRFQGGTLAVPGVPTPGNVTAGGTPDGSHTTVRQLGYAGGVNIEFRDRYIVDALIRRDGSSLFGALERWATFGRVSGAWRLSEEEFWPLDPISEFKLRASYGTAGGSPNFAAQYETWTVGAGGVVNTQNLGNRLLKPEKIHETELGFDIEVLNRFGLNVTWANSESRDQILPVPLSVATGYGSQWQNAGTLETKAFEAALSVPLITRRDLNWSARVVYDNSSTTITRLDVNPFNFGTPAQATATIFRAEEGETFGNMYGRYLVVSCSELPTDFQSQCGPGRAFQRNSDGFVVWVGEGNNTGMGISDNLWQTALADDDAPWGFGLNWGTPIVLRDEETGAARVMKIGNALPDWRLGISQTLTWRRFSLYGLLDGVFGRDVWNQGRAWALLDYMAHDTDQAARSVQEAKPVGYYWRGKEFGGLGGLYDGLGANNFNTESADYLKLRELSLSYRFGQIGGFGDWQASLIGRNLFTITDYTGFDPEVGLAGGQASSGIINAIDAFTFPNLRTITFSLQTSF